MWVFTQGGLLSAVQHEHDRRNHCRKKRKRGLFPPDVVNVRRGEVGVNNGLRVTRIVFH